MESPNAPSHDPTLEDLLEAVTDWASFLRFAKALAADRAEAEAIERSDPQRYAYGGARGWQNQDISSFLSGAIAYAETPGEVIDANPPGTWRDLAEFLYSGKSYE